MRIRLPQAASPARRPAFTLVELLVAMAIFVVLATIAISAYRGVSDVDRLRNGTQQLQSMINGARSRAIKEKLPRGLRLLPSPADPTCIDRMVYIGSLPNITASASAGVLQIIDDPPSTSQFSGRLLSIPSAASPQLFSELIAHTNHGGTTTGAFTNTAIQRYGLRIRLGVDGDWYRIEGVIEPVADPILIRLAEPYRFASTTGPTTIRACEIELGPVVLPGSEAVSLPRNIVIPLQQNPPAGSGPHPHFAQVIQPVVGANQQIDILFGTNGSLYGTQTAGVLRFLLVDQQDHELGRIEGITDSAGDPIEAPVYTQRVVTVVGATGAAYRTESGPRGDYFRYANRGQEAKQ
jgi:prepilin-type N-terminal cleavage/methylation domain-containing protein